MDNAVTFNNNQLNIVEFNNQRCLTATDIAKALGFGKVKSVSNIYTRHADEFEGMSWVINLMTKPQSRHNRVFNREGAWLIGMFARTPKAAEFRKWVLKVLGAVADNKPKAVMVMEHTRSLPTGKKEIVLSDKAKVEIGSIIKTELHKIINSERTGCDKEVTDQDLLLQLHWWKATKDKQTTLQLRRLNDENAQLKERLSQISALLK